MSLTPALMLQGTGSHVGKSLLVAGLGRAYARRGLRVRPFKPQNMSNNAAVTADSGEIGRAQALQARACGVAPSVHMNPVLLKPQSEVGAQVVVQGRVLGNYDARTYFQLRPKLMPYVLDSYGRVGKKTELVLVEGAGSPAEVNLRGRRHREHGVCRSGGCAGRAGRGHRAGRGDRGAGRDLRTAGAGRTGAPQGLYRQQVPRRCCAVR